MKKFSLILLSLLFNYLVAQNFTPGNTYFGTDSLIEYQCGNLPIILSAPHGGYSVPSSLPDRNCVGCVTGRDSYTQELTREITAAIIAKTGCYPHVIINKLHRKKLDANREIIEATDSHTLTEPYWHDYMNFVDSARAILYKSYPKGLFLDIHGHGHTIQRLEMGYLLTSSDLRKNDSALNTTPINNKTSLLNLRYSNLHSYSHAQLIRGTYSLGSIIQRKGIPAVPSDSIPFPLLGEPYFNGGYNTRRFGSNGGGTIDGIQIESHQGVRFNASIRAKYADSLASAILEFIEKHYFSNFSSNYCNLTSISTNQKRKLSIFPNPANNFITVIGSQKPISYQLYNTNGSLMKSGNTSNQNKIDLSSFPPGLYVLKITTNETYQSVKVILH